MAEYGTGKYTRRQMRRRERRQDQKLDKRLADGGITGADARAAKQKQQKRQDRRQTEVLGAPIRPPKEKEQKKDNKNTKVRAKGKSNKPNKPEEEDKPPFQVWNDKSKAAREAGYRPSKPNDNGADFGDYIPGDSNWQNIINLNWEIEQLKANGDSNNPLTNTRLETLMARREALKRKQGKLRDVWDERKAKQKVLRPVADFKTNVAGQRGQALNLFGLNRNNPEGAAKRSDRPGRHFRRADQMQNEAANLHKDAYGNVKPKQLTKTNQKLKKTNESIKKVEERLQKRANKGR